MSSPRKARLLRATLDVPGPVEPTSDNFSVWASVAVIERVIPQLYEIVSSDPSLRGSPAAQRAEQMQLDTAALDVRLERSLLDVADVLAAADVPMAVLKGAATAHLDYDDPAHRQFGDVDLLVDPCDFGRARMAIEEAGWRQTYALPRHHERFTHAVTFKTDGIAELDLHQRIAHRALGLLVPTPELMEHRVAYRLADRELWALGDLDRLIHAALHAATSRGAYRRLSSVADVLALSHRLNRCAHEVLDRADRWSVRPLVEAAILGAHAEAMLPMPEEWERAAAEPTRRRNRLVDRAYLGQQRRPATEELAYLRHISRWRDRMLYLYGHLRMDSGPGSGGLAPRLGYLRSRLRQRT